MEINQILEAFNQSSPEPKEAIQAAIECREEITPIFLERLQRIIDNPNAADFSLKDDLMALFLLSYFREQKAFPLIIQLASIPGEWPNEFFGDVITEGLASFIVSTYDGDLQAITSLIESREAFVWSRVAALNSLLGIFAEQKISRKTLLAYYQKLMRADDIETDDIVFITKVAENVISLYPKELYYDLMRLFDKDLIDLWFFGDQEYVDEQLALGMEECLKQHIYEDKNIRPITNVVDEVGWLYREEDYKPLANSQILDDEEEEEDDFENEYCGKCSACTSNKQVRVIKIGRNEPCPCGSSKKYKKCCLDKIIFA